MANIKEISTESRFANNMSYMFADFVESMLMVAESEFKQNGLALKFDQKKHFKALLFHARSLREVMQQNSMKQQINWAEDADFLFEAIVLICDRIGTGEEERRKLLDDLRNRPTVANINLSKFGFND